MSVGFYLCILSFSYACSKTGHVFEIDLQKVTIKHVRRLLPNESKAGKDKQKGGPSHSVQIPIVTHVYLGKLLIVLYLFCFKLTRHRTSN